MALVPPSKKSIVLPSKQGKILHCSWKSGEIHHKSGWGPRFSIAFWQQKKIWIPLCFFQISTWVLAKFLTIEMKVNDQIYIFAKNMIYLFGEIWRKKPCSSGCKFFSWNGVSIFLEALVSCHILCCCLLFFTWIVCKVDFCDFRGCPAGHSDRCAFPIFCTFLPRFCSWEEGLINGY